MNDASRTCAGFPNRNGSGPPTCVSRQPWWQGVSVALIVSLAWTLTAAPISVIIRYDDYSSISQTEVDKAVIGLFEKHKCTCTFGVIPSVDPAQFCDPDEHHAGADEIVLTDEKAALLRQAMDAGWVEAAMHGCCHRDINEGPARFDSEFAGLEPDEQIESIKAGKRVLEQKLSQRVVSFIPPFNTYGPHTVAALEQAGFTVLSADMRGPTPPDTGLKLLPQTCNILDVQQAVETARADDMQGAVIVSIFHPQDLHAADEMENPRGLGKFLTLRDVDALLTWLCAQDDVRVLSLRQASEELSLLSAARYGAWKHYLNCPLLKMLPPMLPNCPGYYPPPDGIKTLHRRVCMSFAVYLVILAAVGFVCGATAGVLAFRRLRRGAWVAGIGICAVLVAGVVVIAVFSRPYGWKDAAIVLLASGLAAGLGGALLRRRLTPSAPVSTDSVRQPDD